MPTRFNFIHVEHDDNVTHTRKPIFSDLERNQILNI